MKSNSQSGVVFLCLLALTGALRIDGQTATPQAPPATPQATPTSPGTPTVPQPPTRTTETQQPGSPPAPQPQPPQPEPPRNTADGHFSIELFGWYTTASPVLRTGKTNFNANPSNLDFNQNHYPTPGIMVSIPAGKSNTLRISWFRAKRTSDFIPTQDLTIYNQAFDANASIRSRYQLDAVKVSFDYLSWPYPLKGSRFRLKTLWEINYINTTVNVDSTTTDSNGNISPVTATHSKAIILPTLGIGIEESISRNLRFEARLAGMGFPHRSAIWDGEAAFGVRVKKAEIRFGGKAFYFKTTPKADEYLKGTLWGPFVAFRWY